MTPPSPLLYESKIDRLSWRRTTLTALIFLCLLVTIYLAAAGKLRTSGINLTIPNAILLVLFYIEVWFSKTQLRIAQEPDESLQLTLTSRTGKVILQSTIQSMYYWGRAKAEGSDAVGLRYLEVKTGRGVVGFMSKNRDKTILDKEKRTTGFSGNFPKFSMHDVQVLIDVLHSGNAAFSFK